MGNLTSIGLAVPSGTLFGIIINVVFVIRVIQRNIVIKVLYKKRPQIILRSLATIGIEPMTLRI